MLFEALRGQASFQSFLIFALSSLVVIFLTLPVHEWAHGFAASKLGDPTAKFRGRLTLNPFAHIDYIGALMIIVFGFGWAKPVPINSRYFKNPKLGMAITAFAGPFSNLVLALIALLLFNTVSLALGGFAIAQYVLLFLYFIIKINISLAVFNLVPIPPLDGSKILNAVLPDRIYFKIMQYEQYFFIVIIVLLYTGILSIPLNFLSNYILTGLKFLADLPFKLFI